MSLANSSYWVYRYDQLGQVISGRRYWADGTPVAGKQFDYGFDDIGNRTSTGGRASAESTYTVNDLNQYTQRTVAGKIDVFGIANPPADHTQPIPQPGGRGSCRALTSDPQDRRPRVGQESQGSAGASPSRARVVHDTDGNLIRLGQCTYVWGNGLSGAMQGAGGVGGLLKVVHWTSPTASTEHFVAYDGNGNVMGLVQDSNGTISARYEYGPFGEPLRATGAMAAANPVRFSSKYCDGEAGINYYGYRYYDPIRARWLNRDPIGEFGGRNLYGSVGIRPIYRYDKLAMAETGPVDGSPVPTETSKSGQGIGPVTIRWYYLDASCCTKGCNAVMTEFANNLNTLTRSPVPPVHSRSFVSGDGSIEAGKTLQSDGPVAVNHCVSVTKASDNCVRFRTLKGRPEIGDIEFCCHGNGKGAISFTIVSTIQPATVEDPLPYMFPVRITGPLIDPFIIDQLDPNPAAIGARGDGYLLQTWIWGNLLNKVASFANCGSKRKTYGDRWIFQDMERFASHYYTAHP